MSAVDVLAAVLLASAVLLWPGTRPRSPWGAPWPRSTTPAGGVATTETTPTPAPASARGAPGSATADGLDVHHPDHLAPTGSWLRRRAARGRGAAWVAELAELSALGLRAGLAPADAAALACEVAGEAPRGRARRAARRSAGRGAPWGVVSAAVATARRDGTSVGAALAEVAAALRTRGVAGAEEVGLLGAAWRLSEETGAPAAPAAAGAAAVVRGRVRAAERRAALVAGPRASMTLLTALPLSGPVLTALVGLPVTQVYARGLVPAVVTLGLLLTAAGWWWARTSLQRALRGSPLRGGRR